MNRPRLTWRRPDTSTIAAVIAGSAMIAGAIALVPHLVITTHVQTVADTTTSDTTAAQTSGHMCVFYAPGSFLGIETGHVGWAVQKIGTDGRPWTPTSPVCSAPRR
jgi:hypothetical protein